MSVATSSVRHLGDSVSDAQLFQGFNSFTGKVMPSTVVSGTHQSGSGHTDIRYKVCTSRSELYEALNLSGELSYAGLWGDYDAKASYFNSLAVTDTNIAIVIYASRLKTIQASSSQCAVPGSGDTLLDVFTVNGDSWISSLDSGSEFIYTLVIRTHTSQSQQEAMVSVNAALGALDGEVKAQFQSCLNQLADNASLTISVSQNLSGISTPGPLPSTDQCIDWVLNTYPGLLVDQPSVCSITLTSYANTAPPTGSRNSAQFWAPLVAAQAELATAASYLSTLQSVQISANDLQTAYSCYGYIDISLSKNLPVINGDIATLTQQVEAMAADPTQPYAVSRPASLDLGTPGIEVAVSPIEGVGGDGGNYFDDVAATGLGTSLVMRGIRLRKIIVSSGDWLNEIKPSYVSTSGQAFAYDHGSPGPAPNEANLQADEIVTSVTLQPNDDTGHPFARAFSLTTTQGGGPGNTYTFGKLSGGSSPSWSGGGNVVFLGFRGHSGGYVDKLGIVQGVISTIWTPHS